MGSVVLSFNTYFLAISTQGHEMITAASAFCVSALFVFMVGLDAKNNNSRYLLASSLLLFVSTFYDIRMSYIVLFVMVLYLLYFLVFMGRSSEMKVFSLLGKIFAAFFCFILLNFYWFLPQIESGSLLDNAVLNRSLFGNNFWSLQSSFTLLHPFWTGSAVKWFIVQPISFYSWLIPIFAFIGFLLNRKNKYITFFTIISLVGIFLTKQVDQPFSQVYPWLFAHFPGFNAFREASKFYFLNALGYSALLGSLVAWILKNSNKNKFRVFVRNCSIVAIVTLFLWNTKPIVTGEIGAMFTPRRISSDYLMLKNFVESQSDYSRTYWVPRNSRWGINTNLHPEVSGVDTTWANLFLANNGLAAQNQVINVFQQSFSKTLFGISSIKYVVIPIQDISNDDDFFQYYGGDKNPNIRQWYIDQLDKVNWLKKVDVGATNLVIYENKNYKELIFPFSKLYDFDSANNLDSKFNFINKKLNTDFYFSVNDKKTNTNPLIKITNPFEDLSFSSILSDSKTLVSTSSFFVSNKDNTVYANKKVFGVYGVDTDSKIQININYGEMLKIGNQIISQNDSQNILNISKNLNTEYYLEQGSNFTAFTKGNTINLGNSLADSQISIFASSNNLINNPSFESGSWQDKVGDCNNYDSNPVIGMNLTQQNMSSGAQSLELYATKHTACVNTKISIQDIGKYVLTFDFQSPNAKQASFYLVFNDKEKTEVKDVINIVDANWNTYRRLIVVPQDATSATLYIYAKASDNVEKVINRYDNFNFSKLKYISAVEVPTNITSEYSKNILPKSNAVNFVFTYQDKNYNYQNIIPNPSFESGPWQDKVGDCHNFDKNPILGMDVNKEVKSDGEQSLQLEATRHNACTAIGLNVTTGGSYLFSFDYQSPNADHALYYFSFNDKEKTIISEDLAIKDKNWNTFSKLIKVPEGATSVSLYVYADSTDEKTNIINRYDNFKLIEVPDLSDAYYLVSDPGIELEEPKSITFDLINPTKKLVHIKGATTPFYLAMSESYHEQWQLQFNNDKVNGFFGSWVPFVKPDKIADEYHYKLNDFLNGWYVDVDEYCVKNSMCTKNADGTYDIEMVLEFFPQRWFYLGLLISGTTLVGCLGYLGYAGINSLRLKRKKKKESII